MEINRNSWHCKFLQWGSGGSLPTTDCGYVWKLAVNLIFTAIMLGILGVFIAGALYFIFCAIFGVVPPEGSLLSELVAIGFIALCVSGGLTVLCGVFYIIYKINNKLEQADPNSSVSIVVQYLKNRKNKICGTINYVEK